MMIRYMAALVLLASQHTFAMPEASPFQSDLSQFDSELLKRGAVDKNYKVIDKYIFNKAIAEMNLGIQIQFSRNKNSLPDGATMNIDFRPDGITYSYNVPLELPETLDESRTEAFKDYQQNIACQYMGDSQVLQNLNWSIHMQLYDKHGTLKFKESIRLKDCKALDAMMDSMDEPVEDSPALISPKKSTPPPMH